MTATVGFLGLGLMGAPMAANLSRAGTPLVLYNRTAAKAAMMAGPGAVTAATPLEVGRQARVVFMMLTGPEAIDALLWGEEGLAGPGSRCEVVVNMSSVPPAYNRQLLGRLQDKGMALVEAPVSGSTDAAAAGSLVIFTGGDAARLEALSPYLLAMGKKVVYCGVMGRATSMKMVINLLLGIMLAGLGEAVTLGEKCGFNAAEVLDVLLAGPLGCEFYQAKAALFVKKEYGPGFPVKHMCKDLGFIAQTADEAQARVPMGSRIRELYEEARAAGLADEDFSAIKKIFET